MRGDTWAPRAYVRQGEWFFVPAPDIEPLMAALLRNEPLTRGSGTAHVIELAYRRGGETVWVNRRHPIGITEERFRRLTDAVRRDGGWLPMLRDAQLFAKGAVRHPDYATIVLTGGHSVVMNTEQGARAMQFVAFPD